MIVLWGTQAVRTKVGYVAEHCPVCHELGPAELVRIGRAGHIYYISLTRGTEVGYLARCIRCGGELPTDRRKYSAVQRTLPADGLETLIKCTYPFIREVYAAELAKDELLLRHPESISPEERWKFILKAIASLNAPIEEAYTRNSFDKQSSIGCLATTVLLAIFGTLAYYDQDHEWPLKATIAVALIGGAYTTVQLGLRPYRVRDKITSIAARALAPLKPSAEEVTLALTECRKAGLTIGKKVKPKALMKLLQAPGLK